MKWNLCTKKNPRNSSYGLYLENTQGLNKNKQSPEHDYKRQRKLCQKRQGMLRSIPPVAYRNAGGRSHVVVDYQAEEGLLQTAKREYLGIEGSYQWQRKLSSSC